MGRLRELYLNAGVRITFTDHRLITQSEPKVETYEYKGGIKEYIAYMNRDNLCMRKLFFVQGNATCTSRGCLYGVLMPTR